MRMHLKIVAVVNILFGAIGALAGLAILLGGTFGSLMSGSFVGAIAGTAASVTIGLLFACVSLVGIVAGFGLLNGRQWARYTLIVVSVFKLFPIRIIGTAFAVYSLWVLLNGETQRMFATSDAS